MSVSINPVDPITIIAIVLGMLICLLNALFKRAIKRAAIDSFLLAASEISKLTLDQKDFAEWALNVVIYPVNEIGPGEDSHLNLLKVKKRLEAIYHQSIPGLGLVKLFGSKSK